MKKLLLTIFTILFLAVPCHAWWESEIVSGDTATMSTLGSPTYESLQDWMNTTQSSGKISGGGFTDNADGSMTVAAGIGLIRATNSALAEVMFFDWAEDATVSLTDASTNYIIVDYSSGTPAISSTVTKTDGNNRDVILLGKVYRDGTTLHFVEAGMYIAELARSVLVYLNNINGEVVRASGYAIAETGERYFTSTNGTLQAGLTTLTTTGIDTSGADTFETYYYDGDAGPAVWVEGTLSQVDNLQYNNVATGLATLSPNQYGILWVYGDPDGHLMGVYGQDSYTLAEAEAANPPTSLPGHVANFGFIAAKAIVKKSATNLYAVEGAYETSFTPSGAAIHNELSSLQGGTTDEYYHLTSDEEVRASVNNYEVIKTSAATLTVAESHNTLINNNTQSGSMELEFYGTLVAGMGGEFRQGTAAQAVIFDPPGAIQILLDGVPLTAGYSITNNTTSSELGDGFKWKVITSVSTVIILVDTIQGVWSSTGA